MEKLFDGNLEEQMRLFNKIAEILKMLIWEVRGLRHDLRDIEKNRK
jgi:hypothetical protein